MRFAYRCMLREHNSVQDTSSWTCMDIQLVDALFGVADIYAWRLIWNHVV